MKKNIVYLEITSWSGCSIGATHYYGKMCCHDLEYKSVEIEKKMTDKDAKKLSKKDNFEYRVGGNTSRFDSRDEIINIAKNTFKSHFPSADVLILGRSSCAEPQEILFASPDLISAGNDLFSKLKKMKWINRGGMFYRSVSDEKKVDKLVAEWRKLGL